MNYNAATAHIYILAIALALFFAVGPITSILALFVGLGLLLVSASL